MMRVLALLVIFSAPTAAMVLGGARHNSPRYKRQLGGLSGLDTGSVAGQFPLDELTRLYLAELRSQGLPNSTPFHRGPDPLNQLGVLPNPNRLAVARPVGGFGTGGGAFAGFGGMFSFLEVGAQNAPYSFSNFNSVNSGQLGGVRNGATQFGFNHAPYYYYPYGEPNDPDAPRLPGSELQGSNLSPNPTFGRTTTNSAGGNPNFPTIIPADNPQILVPQTPIFIP